MLGYLLLWGCIGIFSTIVESREPFSNRTISSVRCFAHCLETFQQDANTKGKACENVRDCSMCTSVCSLPTHDLFGPICGNGIVCKRGCKSACKFTKNMAPASDKEKLTFDAVNLESDLTVTSMSWRPPVGGTQRDDQYAYVILVREKGKNSTWDVLLQTTSTNAEFSTDSLPMPSEFQLLASSTRGIVATSTFSPKSDVVGWHQLETGRLGEPKTATYVANGVLNVSIEMDVVERQLQVTLLWSHPQKGLVRCGSDDIKCHYSINWDVIDCEVYPESPPCWNLPYSEATSKEFYYSESPNFTIPGMTFNTETNVDISIEDSHQNKISGYLQFRTPLCLDTNIRMTNCNDDERFFLKNNPVNEDNRISEKPVKQKSGKKKKNQIDNKIPKIKSKTNDTEPIFNAEPLSWQDLVNLKMNRTPQMTFDPSNNKMEVNLTWSAVVDPPVEFEVSWYVSDQYVRPERNRTRNTHMLLRLDVDTEYIIMVSTENLGHNAEVVDTMHLFTQKNLSSSPVIAQPITLQHKNDLGTLSGVIAAVVVATILIIVGFVFLFYKMRKSFKDIIITKTFVTKSNSYKSNVGAGKSNYSNQLMVISDEWELDPKLLKFSTPLGQGAFGKVVTGYCNDQKVAIKLVKEGAPLSYKEDLVAEINLMKRVGSNPNIVSMIGACTLNEPIALVMEFVPHGNLQNFLKKCRMDGDLRKRPDGASEIAYAMVHESGDIENCLITPADMLSFARQVAMAMEYLTDRRYVHRDLAARNVLLGYNKVVKLCDFGLSRDIYNDNQYKKLTNGKLPLKWMAIESLRDRVFTTHSDVWSFGVLLWEIVTMGASPYPHIALSDLYYVLVNGYRMEKTSNCSEELYAIMLQCWAALPQDRPCFTQLRMMLEELLEQDRNYLVLENINVPLNTSENSSTPSSLDDMSAQPSGASSGILIAPMTKEELRVNVCIHGKSTDRLLRKSESDSSP